MSISKKRPTITYENIALFKSDKNANLDVSNSGENLSFIPFVQSLDFSFNTERNNLAVLGNKKFIDNSNQTAPDVTISVSRFEDFGDFFDYFINEADDFHNFYAILQDEKSHGAQSIEYRGAMQENISFGNVYATNLSISQSVNGLVESNYDFVASNIQAQIHSNYLETQDRNPISLEDGRFVNWVDYISGIAPSLDLTGNQGQSTKYFFNETHEYLTADNLLRQNFQYLNFENNEEIFVDDSKVDWENKVLPHYNTNIYINKKSISINSIDYDESRDVGYMGEVATSDFINGDDLAAEFGLTAGISQNSTAGWLKFYVGPNAFCNRQGNAYILYVAKRTMRYDLSWNDINGAGLVDGSSTIDIGGNTYSVRLMQGADKDSSTYTLGTNCADNPGENSEWNELFYRVSEKIPDCANPSEGMEGGASTIRHGGPQNGSNWANFTNSELNVNVGNGGRIAWCQEVDGLSPSRRVYRGGLGVALFSTSPASSASSARGWRPCLQLDLETETGNFLVYSDSIQNFNINMSIERKSIYSLDKKYPIYRKRIYPNEGSFSFNNVVSNFYLTGENSNLEETLEQDVLYDIKIQMKNEDDEQKEIIIEDAKFNSMQISSSISQRKEANLEFFFDVENLKKT